MMGGCPTSTEANLKCLLEMVFYRFLGNIWKERGFLTRGLGSLMSSEVNSQNFLMGLNVLQGCARPSPGFHPTSSLSGVVIAIYKKVEIIALIAKE